MHAFRDHGNRGGLDKLSCNQFLGDFAGQVAHIFLGKKHVRIECLSAADALCESKSVTHARDEQPALPAPLGLSAAGTPPVNGIQLRRTHVSHSRRSDDGERRHDRLHRRPWHAPLPRLRGFRRGAVRHVGGGLESRRLERFRGTGQVERRCLPDHARLDAGTRGVGWTSRAPVQLRVHRRRRCRRRPVVPLACGQGRISSAGMGLPGLDVPLRSQHRVVRALPAPARSFRRIRRPGHRRLRSGRRNLAECAGASVWDRVRVWDRVSDPVAERSSAVSVCIPPTVVDCSTRMKWLQKTSDGDVVARLATELQNSAIRGIDNAPASVLAPLLVHRGITDAESAARFLTPSLSHLHDPGRMAGLPAAVDRLDAAIERKEPILIYGDYDVDGTMAVIILKTAIELCGGTADFHVPHRIREGYDMRDDVIERAAAAGIRLIISVDMGIRAYGPAETARRLGVDLIVTDHHLPGHDGVPKALAVIDPTQKNCEYPYKQLCGAGVAFKLAQGLMERRLPQRDQARMLMSFTKVVAIATIADAVPLTGENRVFAKLGLEGLRSPVNPGLKALLEVAQLGGRPLTSGEVAFRIAPRINAAGRMDVARDVIELFSVKDSARAREIANRLDQLNAERQEEERRILEAIQSRFEQEPGLR